MSSWKPTPPPFADFKKDAFAKASAVADLIYAAGEYEALRLPSKDVDLANISTKETQNKFSYIKYCMNEYRNRTGYGRGVTGVQVGIPERFSVIFTPESFLIIVNPKITKKSDQLFRYPEMCMSCFPIVAPVVRPAWIEMEYYDEHGVKQIWNTKDDSYNRRLLNRVLQHEIDHMDGVLNIDIVASPKDLFLEVDPDLYRTAQFEIVNK